MDGYFAKTKEKLMQPKWESYHNKSIIKDMAINLVTDVEAISIINNRKPLGKFIIMYPDSNCVTGIDNSTGEVWMEEHGSLDECIHWLDNSDTEPNTDQENKKKVNEYELEM